MKTTRSRRFLLPSLIAGTLLAHFPAVCDAQTTTASPPPASRPASAARLDPPARAAIIARVDAILDEYYVYPDVAEKIKARLRANLASGAYDTTSSPDQFALRLSRDMIDVSGDRHLGVFYSAENNVGHGEAEMTPEEHARQNAEMKRFGDSHNWGFVKAEILPGNIGYLDVRFFGHPDWAGERVATAMAFVARTDALIIDVRANGGGYPTTVALLASYLLERPSIHGGTETIPLFVQNDRKAGTTTEITTMPYVPGAKYLDRPVYLLTGHRTFSGAELLADALKTNKRAVLVGETTGGGSHSMLTRPINDHMEMAVSFGWTRDAVTGFDWEGKGIVPDVPVPAVTALEKARVLALESLAGRAPDAASRTELARARAEAAAALAAAQPKGPLEGDTAFRLRGHNDAKAVFLAGDFNHFDSRAMPMVRDAAGDGWIVKIDLTPGTHMYQFVVDGRWILDPDNQEKAPGPAGSDMSVKRKQR